MDKNVIYAFLGGLYAGRFTNIFSNTIIAGMVLYFYEPDFYTYSNFVHVKETLVNLLK